MSREGTNIGKQCYLRFGGDSAPSFLLVWISIPLSKEVTQGRDCRVFVTKGVVLVLQGTLFALKSFLVYNTNVCVVCFTAHSICSENP